MARGSIQRSGQWWRLRRLLCNFVELLDCLLATKFDANANIYSRL